MRIYPMNAPDLDPHDGGGHVASLDSPAELIDDLTDSINRVGADA
jgi:hypothetical protein